MFCFLYCFLDCLEKTKPSTVYVVRTFFFPRVSRKTKKTTAPERDHLFVQLFKEKSERIETFRVLFLFQGTATSAGVGGMGDLERTGALV